MVNPDRRPPLPPSETRPEYRVEVLEHLDEKIFQEIYAVETQVFPEDFRLDEEDLKTSLEKSGSINVVLKNAEGTVVGFMASAPNSEFYEDFIEDDPEYGQDADFQNEKDKLYVYDASILEEARASGNFGKIFQATVEKAKEQGLKAITMHTRADELVGKLMQRMHGAKRLRVVERWMGNEPHDYLEVDLSPPQDQK